MLISHPSISQKITLTFPIAFATALHHRLPEVIEIVSYDRMPLFAVEKSRRQVN